MKKSKKIPDDENMPVIDGAQLAKLREKCSDLAEALDKVRRDAFDKIRVDKRAKSRYRGDSYSLSVDVYLRVEKDGTWQGTADHDDWTDPLPTRDAAIRTVLKSELTRVLRQIEADS